MRARATAIFLVLLLPMAAAQWPSFHNDARNAGTEPSVPYAVIEDVWWTVPPVADLKVQASPVHADGILVIAYTPFKEGPGKGLVRGIDVQSGKVRWEHESAAGIVGTPALALGRAYYADKAGNLVGLDLDTGEQVDSAKFAGGSLGHITHHEGKLFFGTENGKVLSYNIEPQLDLLWTFSVTDVFRTSALDANNETICPTTPGNRHEAGAIRSAPAVHGGFVFFGSKNFNVYAVRAAGQPDGTTPVMWTFETGDIIEGSVAIDQARNRVIVGSYDENVYSLPATPAASGTNPCNGHKPAAVWSFEVPGPLNTPSHVHSTPAVADNRVIFGANNGRVYALAASTGAKMWETETGGAVLSSPAIAGKLAVVGSDDRKIHWINVQNGTIGLDFDAGAPVKTSPALDGTDAIAVTDTGSIIRMGATLPARADLRVSSVFADEVGFAITVENVGKANSTATHVLVEWTESVRVPLPPIGPGGSTEVLVDAELGGSIVLATTVDPDDTVWEESESNLYEEAVFVPLPPAPQPVDTNATANATEEPSSVGRWLMIGGIAITVMGLGVGGMLWYNRRQLGEEEDEEEADDY